MPNLTGRRVMVLPVQRLSGGVTGSPDAELGFALEQRSRDVFWILPDELRDAVRASPGFDVRVDNLPVGVFGQAEVRRVGDPLYGNIRRLAALVDAQLALIPVGVGYRRAAAADSQTVAGDPDDAVPPPGRVEVAAALISVVTGRVVWFGVEGGTAGTATDPAALASALDRLALRLAPPTGG